MFTFITLCGSDYCSCRSSSSMRFWRRVSRSCFFSGVGLEEGSFIWSWSSTSCKSFTISSSSLPSPVFMRLAWPKLLPPITSYLSFVLLKKESSFDSLSKIIYVSF